MKTVILAGGIGSRLSEETHIKPKPMLEIGGKPILWHIMKTYAHYGYRDFVVLLGFKGYLVKEFFANYFLHQNDVIIDLSKNQIEYLNNDTEDWKITLLDTGTNTMTGGRIKRAQTIIGDEPFMLTYGDGVTDINIKELISFHNKCDKTVTVTAVQPDGRFGSLNIKNNYVTSFKEKPAGDDGWINGGFFVCNPNVFDYIQEGDDVVFEQLPLEKLAKDNELCAFKHKGFWKPMDTLRDKRQLETLYENGKAKWKIW